MAYNDFMDMACITTDTEAETPTAVLNLSDLLEITEDLKEVNKAHQDLMREILKDLKATMETTYEYDFLECHYAPEDSLFIVYCKEDMKAEFTGYLKAVKHQFLFTLGIYNINILLRGSDDYLNTWEVYI